MPSRKTHEPGQIKAPPTADELRALLAHLLTGAAGGRNARWDALVGKVETVPTWMSPTCNWRVSPSGSGEEREAIEKAVQLVRETHPYVRP